MTSTLPARPPAPTGAGPLPPSGPAAPPAVLVTGAGGPAGIAVVRRLVALGHRVVGVDADPAATGCALATAGAIVPRADHVHFVDALVAVALAHGVDALIPTVAEELPALTAGAGQLARAGVATWLADPAAVETCCDKAAFARALRAAGVPHPATTDTPAGLVEVPGPWVVKPRTGRGSRGLRLLDTRTAVVEALRAEPSLIAQTRLPGREFTADALVGRDGEVLTVVPRWREEVKAGISVKGSTFDSTTVTNVVAGALEAVGLTGPANVQGFVGEDGRATVVEINPRFSGGLPLTLAAGADVVSAYLEGIRHPERRLGHLYFTPGVRMRRYFAEVYTDAEGRLVADPSTAAAVRA
ncbi:ATP-grasp domain-containing protein [Blastococcus sp. SYSU D00820]